MSYEKHNFQDGQVLYAAQLNAMEDMIVQLESNTGTGNSNSDTLVVTFSDLQITEYLENGDPSYGTVVANKTFDEIFEARSNGKVVFGVIFNNLYGDELYRLYYSPDNYYLSFVREFFTNDGNWTTDPAYGVVETTISQNKGELKWKISWSEDDYGGQQEFPLLGRGNVVTEISKDGDYSDRNVPSVDAVISYVETKLGAIENGTY